MFILDYNLKSDTMADVFKKFNLEGAVVDLVGHAMCLYRDDKYVHDGCGFIMLGIFYSLASYAYFSVRGRKKLSAVKVARFSCAAGM